MTKLSLRGITIVFTILLTVAPVFADDSNSDTTIDDKGQVTFVQGVDKVERKLSQTIPEAQTDVMEYPNDPGRHFELAALYSRTNYLEEALKEVKTAKNLILEQDDPKYINQTIQDFEKLTKEKPGNSLAWYRLALAYYLKGYALDKPKYAGKLKMTANDTPINYYNKAQKTFNKVLILNPHDIYARNYLGYLLYKNENKVLDGIKLWKESVAIEPNNNMGAYFLLADAYKKNGDFMNSLFYGAKALEIRSRIGSP